MCFRVEVGGVGEQEAQRVADAAVAFDYALQDFVGDRQLARVVGRGHPQAQHFRAQRVRHLLRRDHVAHGFGHLAPVAVDDEAVGQQRLVRRASVQHAGYEQRRVKPAAVLVRTFEVEVGRELQVRPVRAGAARVRVRPADHGLVGGAGVEPHVQRVLDLDVLFRFRAQQLFRIQRLPGFDAALRHALGHLLQQFERARMQLVGFLVDKEGHGHAPLPLARQRPVGPVTDHAAQARLAPVRIKARVVYAAQCSRAQRLGRLFPLESGRRVHAREPLRAGAVDDGRLVPPAMHVAVHVVFAVEQRAGFVHLLDDLRIGLPDHHAAEERQRGNVFAVGHHRREDLLIRHAVVAAGIEVLHAVGGRAVDDAGAGVQRHVFAEVHRRQALVERMLKADQLQRLALAGRECRSRQFVARQAGFLQVGCEDQQSAFGRDQVVVVVRVHVQRLVPGNGPGRGGPYDDIAVFGRQLHHAESPGDFLRLGERKADVDRKILLVHVLDFGLGQGRTAIEAPVDRLQAAVDVALLQQLAQRADFIGLVAVGHGEVRTVPVAEHAQPLEILLLPLDLLHGVGAGEALRLFHRQVLAVLLLDLALDRHAVAVPTGHIDCIEAREAARLDDDVLQNFVHRMADVDVAIGVRRTVVQDKFRPALGGGANLLVQPPLLPVLDPFRFALGEIAAHGKRRVGEIQGVLVISHFSVRQCNGSVSEASAIRARRRSCSCAFIRSQKLSRNFTIPGDARLQCN